MRRTFFSIAVTHLNDLTMNQRVSTPCFACVTLKSRSFICVSVCVCVNFVGCKLLVSIWNLISCLVLYCSILSKEAAGSTECINDWLTE